MPMIFFIILTLIQKNEIKDVKPEEVKKNQTVDGEAFIGMIRNIIVLRFKVLFQE